MYHVCHTGRLIGHNLLNINTNPLLIGAQSPLPSPHAGRVSSPAPLISAATPGTLANSMCTVGKESTFDT